MEILATLWSYDDRWMLQRKFDSSAWFLASFTTALTGVSSLMIGISSENLYIWSTFRILTCVASFILTLLLGLNKFNSKSQVKKNYLVIILAFLGLINLTSTWSLNSQSSSTLGLSILMKLQVYLYNYALFHVLFIVSLFFLIKFLVLFIALTNPKYLVKIRH
jgi:hypothetical protein